MNKKGFTLVEIITTVALVSVLMLIVIPNLLSQLSSKSKDAGEGEQKIIEEAARVYVDKHQEEFKDVTDRCITIEELKNDGVYSTTGRSGALDEAKGVRYRKREETISFEYGCE